MGIEIRIRRSGSLARGQPKKAVKVFIKVGIEDWELIWCPRV